MAPLDWGSSELDKLDFDTRALLAANQGHELSSECDCLYLPRKEGGRGLTRIATTWERELLPQDM